MQRRDFIKMGMGSLLLAGPGSSFLAQAMESHPLDAKIGDVDKIKFSSTGHVIPYQGCTVISKVPHDSAFYQAASNWRGILDDHGLGANIYLLPPSSYHATIFGAAADKVRGPGHWPSDLSLDCSFGLCNAAMVRKLQDFDLQAEQPFRFKINYINAKTIKLSPIDAQEKKKLRRLRDRLSDLLKVRHEDHDIFEFHNTIGYLYQPLTDRQKAFLPKLVDDFTAQLSSEAQLIELPSVGLYFFDNMLAYYPELMLGTKRS